MQRPKFSRVAAQDNDDDSVPDIDDLAIEEDEADEVR